MVLTVSRLNLRLWERTSASDESVLEFEVKRGCEWSVRVSLEGTGVEMGKAMTDCLGVRSKSIVSGVVGMSMTLSFGRWRMTKRDLGKM